MSVVFPLFPPEIHGRIFRYCKTSDLINVACCSKKSEEDVIHLIWSSVRVQLKWLEDPNYIIEKTKHLCYTTKLALCGYTTLPMNRKKNREKSFQHILKSCDPSKLRELIVQDVVLPKGTGLREIFDSFTGLENLFLSTVSTSCISDWSNICNLTHLTQLCLCNCNIQDVNLANLHQLTNLRELNINSCFEITDQGLMYLSRLSLRKLDISICFGVSDEGIFHISNIRTLESLNCFSCYQITDASLTYICKLPELKELDIRLCHLITDAGLKQMKDIKKIIFHR